MKKMLLETLTLRVTSITILVETALSDLNVSSPWYIIPKKMITRTDITVARKVYVAIFDH